MISLSFGCWIKIEIFIIEKYWEFQVKFDVASMSSGFWENWPRAGPLPMLVISYSPMGKHITNFKWWDLLKGLDIYKLW